MTTELAPLRRWKILKPRIISKKNTRWELYCVVTARSESEAIGIANRQTCAGKKIHAVLESPEETAAIAAHLNSYWKPRT